MSAAHLRYLIVGHGIGGAVANLAINAVIAWSMFHSQAQVPFWGQQSIVSDTVGTTFFLPFFTCLIVTRIARRHVRDAAVPRLNWDRASHPVLAWLPEATGKRAFRLGLATMATVAPPSVLFLLVLGVTALPLWSFVAFKAMFAAVLAFFVQPLVGLWAIAEPADV